VTWAPGYPEIVQDKYVLQSGWRKRLGNRCLNLYQPPDPLPGDPAQAARWVKHVYRIYAETDAQHIIYWLAQRVQHPEVKINHALVLGGSQGIGKDTLLAPVQQAVGAWNFQEISPKHFGEIYNTYVKAVILRVNEARDLGEGEAFNRYSFYDRTKQYAAAPPPTIRCSDKYVAAHYVFNVLGLLLTTNHKTDGLYLPADDRHHFVAWSLRSRKDFTPDYWNGLWRWYENEGGYGHVAAFLRELDLSDFDPKAPPTQTPAFWDIAAASEAPEDDEVADALDDLNRPEICAVNDLVATSTGNGMEWMLDRRHRRSLPHRLERQGYIAYRNPDANDGLWRCRGRRVRLYVRTNLPPNEWLPAAHMYLLRLAKTNGNS
jgi:hypothetical protein